MERLTSPAGINVSYERGGQGPPLVLVHGSFSDHDSNWKYVRSQLEERFTVYALARRGRGETDATRDHRVEDEAADVAALIESIGVPVFLLGHSYGAHIALVAAAEISDRVGKLILYEPPRPEGMSRELVKRLERLADADKRDELAVTFFHEANGVPMEELDELRATEDWPPIHADAVASLGDLKALLGYDFDAGRYRGLSIPVMLQIGTESPRENFVTDQLVATLPVAHIDELSGQAHEGMTMAPDQYLDSVLRFLCA